MKIKGFHIIVKHNNPILGDGGKIVIHKMTKNLDMFTLVTSQKIRIHHVKRSILQILILVTKIANENIISLNKLDQNIDRLQ